MAPCADRVPAHTKANAPAWLRARCLGFDATIIGLPCRVSAPAAGCVRSAASADAVTSPPLPRRLPAPLCLTVLHARSATPVRCRAASARRAGCADAGHLCPAGLPRLRGLGGQGPRAARRVRRPEAGAASHPVRDERDGAGGWRQAGQERARGRRRARQVPSARRPGRLRGAGADGAGLLAALPADRRPGQLRLARRRWRGGDALHRGAAHADRAAAARRA